ncbi:3-methylcrotonyl-CoA carboxylase [Rhodosalinus halophilus]|uniref:3-methylcrotonyl-CoA carboxylase n=1 Tax=Rhodosalinus halophilus TaxID=2259333 RepID=A0A365U4X6_9RHOB|nr:biotin carboxylase N-terminal domain-containing protein [Rhodosalinus halophilus]RBI83337.1 3-methylcrotonyl-CoA carboxylase [Rhodosalinus halophilus]
MEFLAAPRPIRSVLIANRGEIACRIIATCRRLGLRTVAVHSEADTGARHVRMADDACLLGGAAPADSYLNIERIVAAAQASGADAVHPGYGFLSENAGFVRAVEAAGLIFVGPTAEAVERMGSKIAARRIAEAAGVPVVPGFDGAEATDAELAEAADRIGYPLLVKASAGGGGRGMRRVMAARDLAPAIRAARAEAASAFGDATVFLEKLVPSPRHLEVQVFGDGTGGVLHLHERDCSVQRAHQKIIEEAPAPNLPGDVRETLFAHATALAAAIRYRGAGTVEFVMQAGDATPYFLEMNTRLQVEHPVTEAICGVDLVEWQLRQAAGLPLPLAQDQLVPRGHAIEVRVNAERPEAGFLPDAGRLDAVVPPPGLRFETGVETGDAVPSDYDPMIAKVVAHAPDRARALARLRDGIDATVVAGVGTNLGFARDCLSAPAFMRGEATTGFLEESFPDGWRPDPEALLRLRGEAARAALSGGGDPLARADGFRVGARAAPGRVPLMVGDEHGLAEITLSLGAPVQVQQGERCQDLGAEPVWITRAGGVIRAAARGLAIAATVRPLAEARMDTRAETGGEGRIAAPLPGRVTEVLVAEGDHVEGGATLAVIEAMKLVHALTAPFAGRVVRIGVTAGETVPARALLIELEREKEEA